MADALKRLGGGRWQTKDGRFTIEPQSGTWVLVDAEQTDELGLSLVRGPFPSLTAAKEAIEAARESKPAESPLAGRLRDAGTGPGSEPGSKAAERRKKAKPQPPPEPPEPPEPKWLRDLPARTHREATELIDRLGRAGIGDPEAIARAEITADEPAVARAALERRLGEATQASDARAAVETVIDALLEGRDRRLDVRWRLVDGEGRDIRRLDLPPAAKRRG